MKYTSSCSVRPFVVHVIAISVGSPETNSSYQFFKLTISQIISQSGIIIKLISYVETKVAFKPV